jgi:hypothetical protein
VVLIIVHESRTVGIFLKMETGATPMRVNLRNRVRFRQIFEIKFIFFLVVFFKIF